jgi:hypothetical protein
VGLVLFKPNVKIRLSFFFYFFFISHFIKMSFWNAEDKIPIKQTRVSIPAEHGLNYTDGQLIRINIPPTVQFFQPKETYLSCEIKIDSNSAQPTRYQLDAELGGQVLIKDIRIMSGGAGSVLLEEIQDYNVLTALRYDYEQNESIRNKRSLTEGTTQYCPQNRGTFGGKQSNLMNVTRNPWSDPYVSGAEPGETADGGIWGRATDTPAGTNGGLNRVKVLLPLHTGIFMNDKVFPTLLTQGLRIEILLEKAGRCMRLLDTNNMNNRISSGPIFHSIDRLGAANGGKDDEVNGDGLWRTGLNDSGAHDVATHVWCRRDNQMIGMENFPLVVGEEFDIIRSDRNPIDTAGAVAALAGRSGFVGAADATATALIVEEIKHFAAQGSDSAVGGRYGLTRIKLKTNVRRIPTDIATGTAMDADITGVSGQWVLVSRAPYSNALSTPSITLSNVELILQQVDMPSGYINKLMTMMKSNGTINYDFLSQTNYKYSQLKSDVVANIRLPLSQSRAKAILSIPTDSSVYTNPQLVTGFNGSWGGTEAGTSTDADTWQTYPAWDDTQKAKYTYNNGGGDQVTGSGGTGLGLGWTNDGVYFSCRSGLVGVWDYLKDYQWFYDGKLNPSRKVDCQKVAAPRDQASLSQQWAIEAEKALAMSGIRPLSFRALHENGFIGRALSLQEGVYDTRGRDFNLQVEYSQSADKNHLWHNFVSHIRRMVIKGNQISLDI